jgi:hypothetical protein
LRLLCRFLTNRIIFEGEKGHVQRDSAKASDPEDDGGVDGDSKNESGGVVGAAEGDENEEVEATDPNGIDSPSHLAVMEENPAPPQYFIKTVVELHDFVWN